ncbi:MAG: BON domain-containing protein [Sulfuricaulis sp.]
MYPLLKLLKLLFTSLLLVSFLGCASTPTQEGTGEYVDDSVITAKVKAAIVNDPNLHVFQINVDTFKGTVQLSGFVASSEDVDRATAVASAVLGVKSVKNDLIVK